MRRNEFLHNKLDEQIQKGATTLTLTHDEIDEWRGQFDSPAPPVELLAYKHFPIVEAQP